MAMKLPKVGIQDMMKDGHKILEEAVYRNIQAVKELSQVTRTSLGPNGKNKMIINHLDKLFVTNDAATILREMDIIHPACKVLVLSSEQQQKEVGDSTNFVIVFGGELLQKADGLLRMGLTQSEVSDGFNKACKKALEELQDIVVKKVEDLKSRDSIIQAIKSVIASKQYGYEDFLSPMVADACLSVMPNNAKNFNVDSVRVVKIMGGTLTDSKVVKGMVFGREPEGVVTQATKAKIAVFSCPLDNAKTETKGTVLLKTSEELKSFAKEEEQRLEQTIKAIADTGVKVVVTGSGIGEMALHFLNRYNILALKVLSKFDLRRLCKATNATALARLGAPIAEEIGTCDVVETIEIGSDRVTVFRQEAEDSAMATIVVRGATQNMMDDVERAIDDGVNVVKSLTRDNRLLPGAGAVEIELSRRIQSFGAKSPGLDQYAIKKFGEAFEVIPRTLCENAGIDSTDIISQMYASHQAGNLTTGVDVENEDKGTCDVHIKHIYDSYISKYWAIKFATDAAMTILKVDQIIMSKVAGGPKPKDNPNWDED